MLLRQARATTIMLFLPTLLAVSASALPQDTPKTKDQWSQADLERVTDEIRVQIEELRGMKYARPVAAKITDKQGFLEYARKRQQSTETPERRARDETVAKMLGLIPFDLDLGKTLERFLEGQVGGFYDPGSNTFYLMENFTGDLARIILAHELTHALDDQCFDLDKLIGAAAGETDAEFAIQAMAEGSGTNAMNAWTVKNLAKLDKKALLASSDLGTAGLDTAPTLIWKPTLAAYLRGEGFLVHSEGLNLGAAAAKTEEIRQCFAEPPRSSEQILHPQKYWDKESRDDPRRVVIDTAKLPEGWQVLGEDTLGELYLGLFTQPFGERGGLDAKNPFSILSIKYTSKATEGWGGDRLVLLGKGEERALYLVTVWDTAEDQEEFFAAATDQLTSNKDPEQEKWAAARSTFALSRDDARAAVTLRLEWKTRKEGAAGLPAMLPWSVAK